MRKFFTKKLALTVTVASLLAVQVSGVAAATFSDYVNNYVTASDSTQTDVTTPSDLTSSDVTTPSDSTSSDVTTPSDSTGSDVKPEKPGKDDTDKGNTENVTTPSDSTSSDVTTPSDSTGSDVKPGKPGKDDADKGNTEDVTTPSDSTNSDTTGGNNAGTPDSTGSDVIGNLPQGDHSLPSTVAKDEIVKSDAVNDVLNKEVTSSTETKVDVVSDAAPTLSADLFSAVKANNKDITVGVVNSQDYLLYSWTFKAATLNNTDKNVDLTLNVSDTKNDNIVALTGVDELVYLNFAYHGELPGTATLHTYVGKWFQNGDVVYLYYYNEELNRVEVVGDNEGLKVVDGYVDFDINHCSTYFLSGHTADEVKAVNPATGELAGTPIKTGDHANVMLYVLLSLAAVSAMGLVVVFGKKRAN